MIRKGVMVKVNRYSRQELFRPIGVAGQQRFAGATVAIIGCGALGSAIADQLARAGIGTLRLIDRDFVEASNLQRQCLYTEADAAAVMPKAVAAAERLRAVNSLISYQPLVEHLGASNVERLLADVDVVVDGTDNFSTRHVLNDACCRRKVPWIYGACVGSYGLSMPVLPGTTACLRCLQSELPLAGDGPTCDTVGVIAPIVQVVASWQVAEVFKIIVGDLAAVRTELWTTDLWRGTFQRLNVSGWRDPDCRSCGAAADYPDLHAEHGAAVVLCGRDAVQLPGARAIDLAAAARVLGDRVERVNPYLLRWSEHAVRATAFADGRVIVQGVADEAAARAFVDRWLG